MTQEIRTRIAPSPTGDPHIGTAFMLLFNYCFAKSQGGKVLLRIEDTDRTRSTRESENAIIDSLNWIGITWDEGPDKGGPCGPYRQSERTEIYREHCDTLLKKGHAYRCFCTAERLESLRRHQRLNKLPPGYDSFCANLASEEIEAKLKEGAPYVVRMKVPREGECVLEDMLRGKVVIPWENVDDQVLMKSDGFPTYHLANVVDDRLMGITHVIRGEEWISSAPKHILLYNYFGWEIPKFCHMPLLRNPDKSKLSKRKNPTSILYYRQAGYLPEAMVNYLGLMGYTLPGGNEMFSLAEMVETFDITRVSLGGPIFDLKKLAWLNARYLRERVQPAELLDRLKNWLLNDEMWLKILPLAQTRVEKLSDIVPMSAFFFADQIPCAAEALLPKKIAIEEGKIPADVAESGDTAPGYLIARLIRIALWELEKTRQWNSDAIQSVMLRVAEKEGVKIRDIMPPFFTAVTGSPTSVPLFDAMAILGSDMSRRRLNTALETLAAAGHTLGGKKMKALEGYYEKAYGEKD